MPDHHFLAFDLGAESGRAIVGTLRQSRLTLEEKHRFSTHNGRIAGHLHWNLLSIWEELKMGLRKSAHGGLALSGIGIDTWGVDFGLLTKSGELLGNPYMYRDSRTNGILDRTFVRVPKEDIFNATGIQFMQLNSLFQLLSMRETLSPILDIADTLLFIPDLFNYLFTGQRKAEFSIASTSQMYDMRRRAWATELLQRLHLPTHILPEVIPTGTLLGPILRDVADECGVGQIPLIAPGCHDTASAVAAVPAEGDNWCYISSGTWSLMGVEIPSPIVNDKSLKYNYTNEGGIGGSIRFLKNIMGLWLVQECRRQWLKEGHEHTYAQLARLANDAKPFIAIINPDHQPFLAPGEMPQKIEQFCKNTRQNIPTSPGEFIRTCLESLALTYRRTLEGLQDILGRQIDVIHIVGGGSQNELLNQMTADACGRTVIAGPAEATAAGNLLVQAMALGEIASLPQLRSIVRHSFEVKRYEPRDGPAWQSAYSRFRELV
ncbi:MAG TPA: rhamnulokinase family protein [Tepidisphaeraceae bacterium]|jgi:rhamnulokinase|nr:rhamnulokinase family protein [Tepidisphaeraceae bacterium]